MRVFDRIESAMRTLVALRTDPVGLWCETNGSCRILLQKMVIPKGDS
jgi:hypothetical protein